MLISNGCRRRAAGSSRPIGRIDAALAQRSHMPPITLNRLERPRYRDDVGISGRRPGRCRGGVDHIVVKADGVPLYVERS